MAAFPLKHPATTSYQRYRPIAPSPLGKCSIAARELSPSPGAKDTPSPTPTQQAKPRERRGLMLNLRRRRKAPTSDPAAAREEERACKSASVKAEPIFKFPDAVDCARGERTAIRATKADSATEESAGTDEQPAHAVLRSGSCGERCKRSFEPDIDYLICGEEEAVDAKPPHCVVEVAEAEVERREEEDGGDDDGLHPLSDDEEEQPRKRMKRLEEILREK